MLKYGKGLCELNFHEPIKSIKIVYKGNVYLSHKHFEITHIFQETNSMYAKNRNSKSLILHGNNQIHIGYKNNEESSLELFKYVGEFKIVSVLVNNKETKFNLFGVDYWNLIKSKYDNAGKPEKYNNNYRVGYIPKKGRRKVLGAKVRNGSTGKKTTEGRGY
tara:strand:- start:406 stop:891 length:486 start_codon:yes stop_codon:yes gene_type:complete